MNFNKLKNEHALYSLVFLLAIFLRLLNLGAFTLSDQEASWALLAQQISQLNSSRDLAIGSQPVYVFLTAVSFALLNPNNFTARFWPALIGALLVLTPYLFREKFGRRTALLLAMGLALDPGLVSLSRQAGGPMMALVFAVLALGFWLNHKDIAAGIFSALAILSGPTILTGMLIGIFGWLVLRRNKLIKPDVNTPSQHTNRYKHFFFSGFAAFLIFGTMFFRYPQGISGLTDSVIDFLSGISQPGDISGWRMLVTSWAYQPLAWLFTLIAFFRMLYGQFVLKVHQDTLTRDLFVYAALALSIALIYPKHTPGDLVWFSILLWTIAAIELNRWLGFGEKPAISLLQAAMVFIFSAMFWNTLVSVYQVTPQAGVSWALLQALVLTGILGLAGLSAILVSYTWSWPVSRSGLVIGALAVSIIYTLALLWSATQIRPNRPVELWNPSATIARTNLLIDTIRDLSTWESGMPEDIEIIVTLDSPAMRWLLRDFKHVQYISQVPTTYLPALIITPLSQESPALSAAYRGQDFPWLLTPGWAGSLPDDFVQWLTFRKAAERTDWLILWARVDLFPGEQLSDLNAVNE